MAKGRADLVDPLIKNKYNSNTKYVDCLLLSPIILGVFSN